jgi:hypothetical protein
VTFLLSEDEALRNLLKDMVVTDQKSVTEAGPQRKVKVYFGQPDQELRDQTYPYITIDMIDINEGTDRAMRGKAKPSYLSDPVTGPDGTSSYDPEAQDWEIHWPIPVNIDYQITTYSRQPRHDREILAQILYKKIPMRFAVLEPNDGTVRRLDLLDIAKRDITEQGKRLFVNAFTVRVSSEISPELYNKLYKVLTLDVTGTAGTITNGKGQFTPMEPFTITQP